MVPVDTQQTASVPNFQIAESESAQENNRMTKQEGDPGQNDYVFNCIHENKPFTLNVVGRPVFVNHYYVGEAFIPVTSKKLIKLDEGDVSAENSLKDTHPQDAERECREHSQNLRIVQQHAGVERRHTQRNGNNTAAHSDL